jgi:hypothetical protein
MNRNWKLNPEAKDIRQNGSSQICTNMRQLGLGTDTCNNTPSIPKQQKKNNKKSINGGDSGSQAIVPILSALALGCYTLNTTTTGTFVDILQSKELIR